ncbi:MAG: RIO1 family regulatory kinase/ATPase domain-containing protein [Halobacteriota archaeon]
MVSNTSPLYRAATLDIVQREAGFLDACRRADISVPSVLGVCQLSTCAVLVMNFVDGASLGRAVLRREDINAVFRLLKKLRVHRLVHGDIRCDNFLHTHGGSLCMLDFLPLEGDIELGMSYDLMSAICHLSLSIDAAEVLEAASTFFPPEMLKEGLPYLSFITPRLTHQQRDFLFRTISAL